MSLESAVNLGRRCLQDFYRPRYFILENVRNFVSRRRRRSKWFMMSEDSNTNTKPKSPPVMGRREGGRERWRGVVRQRRLYHRVCNSTESAWSHFRREIQYLIFCRYCMTGYEESENIVSTDLEKPATGGNGSPTPRFPGSP